MNKKQILLLEVNDKNANILKEILANCDVTTVVTEEELDALRLSVENYDLVLANSQIGYIEPKELNELVNMNFVIKIPIIYIDNSKEYNRQMFKVCFENGAFDYIKKPFDSFEIVTRVEFHIEQLNKIREYKLRVDKLSALATQDQISKSSSRMHMQSILKHYLDSFNRDKIDTSVVYLSLENINKIVATFGFTYGEKLLINFSKELKKSIRSSDVLSRWSGSEFMILLPKTSAESSLNVVKKLNNSLSKINILNDTKPIIAYGITSFSEDDNMEEIVSRVKYALKEARKQEYGKTYTC